MNVKNLNKKIFTKKIAVIFLLLAGVIVSLGNYAYAKETTVSDENETEDSEEGFDLTGYSEDRDISIYRNKKILSDGIYTYKYEISMDKSKYEISIIYPDDTEYVESGNELMSSGGFSGAYPDKKYTHYKKLADMVKAMCVSFESDVEDENDDGQKALFIICIILIAGLGVVEIIFPEKFWWLSHGWKYKNAEPSEFALSMGMFNGILLIICSIIGLIMIL